MEIVGSGHLITQISRHFLTEGLLDVTDLSAIIVPAQRPLVLDVLYKSVRPTVGSRLTVHVNNNEIANVRFQKEDGLKKQTVQLDRFVREGENEFRVRCLVSCKPLEEVSDEGLFWLRREDATIIRKKYSTRGTLEPFDQIWKLWVY